VARARLKAREAVYYLGLNNEIGWRGRLMARRDPSHWPYLAVAPELSSELTAFKQALFALVGGDARRDALAAEIDDACLWLLRRALCEKTREPPEPEENAFLERFNAPGSAEQRHLDYRLR